MKKMRVVGPAVVVVWVGCGVMPVAQTPTSQNRDVGHPAPVNGAPSPSGTSGKRPMTFADMMAMKRVSDPQISPSGRWVLFSVTDVSLEKNAKTNHLWVVALETGGATQADSSASLRNDNQKSNGTERQITFGAGESFGRFSPDGTRVSWTQNPGKDESFARIAVAAWDEKTGTVGTAILLTGISGDADGAVWSPDSKRLMLTTQVWPGCSVKGGETAGRTVRGAEAGSSSSGSFDSARSRLAQDDSFGGGMEIGGTRDVSAWKNAKPAVWAEEDACDKAKDAAAEKNPVKAQVWDGLLYRHWDHWTGAKRTHILVADLAGYDPTRPQSARTDGAHDHSANPPERSANPPKLSLDGAPDSSNSPEKTNTGVLRSAQDDGNVGGTNPPDVVAKRDVTTARDVGDAETPTWMLGGPQEYAWAPDSKEIAYVTNLDAVPAASTNNDVFTLRVDEADARPVKVSRSAGSDDEPEYSPDGRYLAFRSQRQAGFESDKFDLVVMDRTSRNIRDLTRKLNNWVDEFTWTPDSKDMVFTFPLAGAEHIAGVGPESAGYSGGQLIGYEGELGELTFVPNANILVGTQMQASRATELFIYDPQHLDPVTSSKNEWAGEKRLTHVNDELFSQLDLSPLESFWFTGAGGTKVEGFLLKPPGFDPAKKYPVKFLLHGGPQTAWGDAWSYRWNWELMAASGYVVIGINRRGSTGYGQKFVDEVSGDWGGRAYEDLMKGLDYAEAHYPFIDKTRECALGASYGGYMADWVLTHTNRFKCIVTHDGLYDAAAAYGATEEMWFPEWEFRRPEDFPKGWDGFSAAYDPMGARKADSSAALRNDNAKTTTGVLPLRRALLAQGPDDGEKQRRSPSGMTNKGESGGGHAAEPWRYAGLPASEDPFRRWSPKEYIKNAKTPTLVIHSQRDYRLDVSQGFELYTALQRQGVPSRFLYFPDEGHWVLKPQNSELWNAVVSDWCDRWTHSGKYAEGEAR